ncbi:E3 ubiquitin ligase family protein [Halorubellus salinus]|uniref:E3 ubiquitin ligase family protein n=1 Tax=Halorubellus salinus TaxID=755309 RepID=UPI001D0997C1|nr:E3 ubiquitin ligase family protein [Halorubellus salinus]
MLEGILQLDGIDLLPLLFLSVFVLVALGLVTYGVANLRTYAQLKSMTPTDAHAVGSGLVEVEGEAAAAMQTLEAPFSGEECVAYEFEVERYRYDDDGSNWDTKASGTRSVPFHIQDETGTVGVKPTESGLSVERNYRTVVESDERPPERIQAFLDGEDHLDHDTATFDVAGISIGGDKHRFTERRLDPGESAYAAGRAEPTTAVDGESPTVVDANRGGRLSSLVGDPFVVADTGEDEAEWRHLKLGVGMMLFGALFGAIPVYVLSQALA